MQLIIFDECHHATHYHPYNILMQEFYWVLPMAQRPKIFGMTASPVKMATLIQDKVKDQHHNLREKHVQAFEELERNLGCRVVTVSKELQVIILTFCPVATISLLVCTLMCDMVGCLCRRRSTSMRRSPKKPSWSISRRHLMTSST